MDILQQEFWRDAECRNDDPELFFYADGMHGNPQTLRDESAKKVCDRCPIVSQCLEYALEYEEKFGFWGGLTERQLRAERSQRKRVTASISRVAVAHSGL